MIPKNQRIPRDLFGNFRGAKNYHGKILYITYVSQGNSKNSRFCISVSKKVAKNATDRNKLRRIGYSFISNNINRIKKSFLIRISFKELSKDKNLINNEINNLLSKSQLI